MEINPTESEKALLGALLLDCNKILEINPALNSKDFQEDKHEKIFDAMKRLYKKKSFFDYASVADELTIDRDYLLHLVNESKDAHVKELSDIIKEHSVKCQLMAW